VLFADGLARTAVERADDRKRPFPRRIGRVLPQDAVDAFADESRDGDAALGGESPQARRLVVGQLDLGANDDITVALGVITLTDGLF